MCAFIPLVELALECDTTEAVVSVRRCDRRGLVADSSSEGLEEDDCEDCEGGGEAP